MVDEYVRPDAGRARVRRAVTPVALRRDPPPRGRQHRCRRFRRATHFCSIDPVSPTRARRFSWV